MRLTDLAPHWISCLGAPPDAKLGVRFTSPTDPNSRIDSFENLSLNPSIDCSKWGGWHGFLSNGTIS